MVVVGGFLPMVEDVGRGGGGGGGGRGEGQRFEDVDVVDDDLVRGRGVC